MEVNGEQQATFDFFSVMLLFPQHAIKQLCYLSNENIAFNNKKAIVNKNTTAIMAHQRKTMMVGLIYCIFLISTVYRSTI